MIQNKYIPEKVLDIKEQNGVKMILIQWLNLPIEQASWQPAHNYPHISPLIQECQRSKATHANKNLPLKQVQQIDLGENPYQQTQRHGHFMYGDEPESIESVKVFRNPDKMQEPVTVIFEIKWKSREEQTAEGKAEVMLLENSFIDTKTISEFRPDFLAKFYEKRIRLDYFPEGQDQQMPNQ